MSWYSNNPIKCIIFLRCQFRHQDRDFDRKLDLQIAQRRRQRNRHMEYYEVQVIPKHPLLPSGTICRALQ